jgi:hypothetical protein
MPRPGFSLNPLFLLIGCKRALASNLGRVDVFRLESDTGG